MREYELPDRDLTLSSGMFRVDRHICIQVPEGLRIIRGGIVVMQARQGGIIVCLDAHARVFVILGDVFELRDLLGEFLRCEQRQVLAKGRRRHLGLFINGAGPEAYNSGTQE